MQEFLKKLQEFRKPVQDLPYIAKVLLVVFYDLYGAAMRITKGDMTSLVVGILQLLTGNETTEDPDHTKNKHHQRSTGTFSRTKECSQDRPIPICNHQWLAHLIHHKATQKQTDRDGKKLKGIATCIHATLQFHRNGSSEDHIQIRTHDRHQDPPNDLADTP